MSHRANLDQIDERFFIHGRMEILDVLNELVYRCEPVTIHFPGKADNLACTLLEARDKTLVFDAIDSADNAVARAALAASGNFSFVAFPDGIRVQFAGKDAQRISWDDKEVFCIPLPEKLARVQRHENFRALVDPARQLAAQVFSSDGAVLGEWPLHDVSVGGVGIALSEQPQLDLGLKAARVKLALPGHGEIDCAVTLRHATGAIKTAADSAYRLGLSFVGLPAGMRVAIQRFIIDSEHERRKSTMNSGANSHY